MLLFHRAATAVIKVGIRLGVVQSDLTFIESLVDLLEVCEDLNRLILENEPLWSPGRYV